MICEECGEPIKSSETSKFDEEWETHYHDRHTDDCWRDHLDSKHGKK